MRRFTIAAALLLAVAAIAIPVALAGGGNSTSADISFSNNATLNAGGSVTLHVTYFCLGSAFVPDAFVDLQEPKGATEVDGFIDFTPVCDNKQHQFSRESCLQSYARYHRLLWEFVPSLLGFR